MNPTFLNLLEQFEELDRDFKLLLDAKEALSIECKRLQQEQVHEKEREREVTRLRDTEKNLKNNIGEYQLEISKLHSEIARLEDELHSNNDKFKNHQAERDIMEKDLQEKIKYLEIKRTEEEQQEKLYEKQQTQKFFEMKKEYEVKILNLEENIKESRAREIEVQVAIKSQIKSAENELREQYARNLKCKDRELERNREEAFQDISRMEQRLEEYRKKESDMKASFESRMRKAALEVRSQYEGKLKRLEEELQGYRERAESIKGPFFQDLTFTPKTTSSKLASSSGNRKHLRVSFNEENEYSYFNAFSDEETSQPDSIEDRKKATNKLLSPANVKAKSTGQKSGEKDVKNQTDGSENTDYRLPDIEYVPNPFLGESVHSEVDTFIGRKYKGQNKSPQKGFPKFDFLNISANGSIVRTPQNVANPLKRSKDVSSVAESNSSKIRLFSEPWEKNNKTI